MFRFRLHVVVVTLAFAIPVGFAWFTGHAWEDYFITLRTSRNLVEGHGLVFTPGERVHTFTSPLGVLVPALCTWIVGTGREELALWLFRFINAGLLAAAALLVWQRTVQLGLSGFGRMVFFGLMLADAKLIDFATNGMETAMLVFFALFLWSELEAPAGPRPGRIAVGCAGLLWTRPDACILGAALIVSHVLLRSRTDGARRIPWRALISGILIGGALYLPWFAWAWWYYGSPIPHTIIAKSGLTAPVHLRDFLLIPWRTLIGDSLLQDIFLPTYWFYGGWPSQLRYVGHALGVVAAFAWLVPRLPLVARRASLAVFLGMFYLCAIILFPWYSPPWMVLAALAIAFTCDQACARAAVAGRHVLASAGRILAGLVIVVQIGVLVATAWQMRIQQRVVEHGVRRGIGEWLRENADRGDTVLLEPLGYIGYYSRLKTYDMPGLSSPEVVSAMRAGARRYVDLIEQLRPAWLALRPEEFADPKRPENAALNAYELVRVWDARADLDAVRVLPGRPWLERDARFYVFRRKANTAAPPPSP